MNDGFNGSFVQPISSPKVKVDNGDGPMLPKIVERLYYNVSEVEAITSNINQIIEKLGISAELTVPAPSESKEFGIVGELDRLNNRLLVLREVAYQIEDKLRKLV